MAPRPMFSVIMLTESKYQICRRTISYLLAQSIVEKIELVLVGPSRQEMQVDEAELAPFHSFKIVEIGKVQSTGHGLAAGAFASTADLVTYAEEHGFPPPNLFEVLLRNTEEKYYQAYGWAMLPSNPGTVAWAHIYGQFAEAVAPRPSGEVTRLGGHHGMYRRDLLMDYKDRLIDLFSCEAVFHEDLQRRGIKMLMIGEVAGGHTQVSNFWSYLWLEFVGQRAFAATRVRNLGWGWGRRLLYIAGSPLIPFVRLYHKLPYVRSTGRWKQLMPQIGFVIFAANCAGTVGEVLGYLTGQSDKALKERLKIELDRFAFVNKLDRDQRHQRSPAVPDQNVGTDI